MILCLEHVLGGKYTSFLQVCRHYFIVFGVSADVEVALNQHDGNFNLLDVNPRRRELTVPSPIAN